MIGVYGVNCLKICDYCMNNEICDIDDGKCDINGCVKFGYKLFDCNG